MTGKTFEFFIFITSAPKNHVPVEYKEDDDKFMQTRFWGMSLDNYKTNLQATQFTEGELYQAMKNINTPEMKVGPVTLVNGNKASYFFYEYSLIYVQVDLNGPHTLNSSKHVILEEILELRSVEVLRLGLTCRINAQHIQIFNNERFSDCTKKTSEILNPRMEQLGQ
jgi:hypothetical protein